MIVGGDIVGGDIVCCDMLNRELKLLSSRWVEISREPTSDMDRVLMGKTRNMNDIQVISFNLSLICLGGVQKVQNHISPNSEPTCHVWQSWFVLMPRTQIHYGTVILFTRGLLVQALKYTGLGSQDNN